MTQDQCLYLRRQRCDFSVRAVFHACEVGARPSRRPQSRRHHRSQTRLRLCPPATTAETPPAAGRTAASWLLFQNRACVVHLNAKDVGLDQFRLLMLTLPSPIEMPAWFLTNRHRSLGQSISRCPRSDQDVLRLFYGLAPSIKQRQSVPIARVVALRRGRPDRRPHAPLFAPIGQLAEETAVYRRSIGERLEEALERFYNPSSIGKFRAASACALAAEPTDRFIAGGTNLDPGAPDRYRPAAARRYRRPVSAPSLPSTRWSCTARSRNARGYGTVISLRPISPAICKKTLHDRIPSSALPPLCSRSNHPTGCDFFWIAMIGPVLRFRPVGRRAGNSRISPIGEVALARPASLSADRSARSKG
jgi:hypothetical protein